MSSIPSSAMPHAFTAPGADEPATTDETPAGLSLVSRALYVLAAPAIFGLSLSVVALSGAARLLVGRGTDNEPSDQIAI